MAIKVPQALVDRLQVYDSVEEPVDEMEIAGQLLATLSDADSYTLEERRGIVAEIAAFRFQRRHGSEAGRWGIYWTELTSGMTTDGVEVVSPDVAQIDEGILGYWIERSGQVAHPVLKARYSDLAWEIGRYLKARSKRQAEDPVAMIQVAIPVTLSHHAIDAYLAIVENDLYSCEYSAWRYLDRAIALAIGIRDKARINLAKQTLYAFYRRLDTGAKWLWWQFDDLSWNHAKGLELGEAERQESIDVLERALARSSDISQPESFDPHSAMSAADRLERWRAQSNDSAAARQAMKTAALAFEEAAKGAGGMTAIAWLEDLIPRHRNAGMTHDAARVEQAIRQRAAEAQTEMKSIEAPLQVSREELDRWVAQFAEGPVGQALSRLAVGFLIKEGATKDSLRAMCKEAPLLSLMPSSIVGLGGFTTATVGSIEADLDGRALQHAATLFSWRASWLHFALDQIKDQYALNADGLIEIVRECQSFAPERLSLLRDGVVAWLSNDPVKAIHLLIPQIEAALRDLLAALGGSVMVPDPDVGGFKAIGLGQVLNHSIFVDKVPKDVRFHLRALYNDPRGINLRNELAHGLVRPELLNMGLANWVIHTVVLVSMLRVAKI